MAGRGGLPVPDSGLPLLPFVPSIIELNPLSQAYVDQASIQIAPWIMGTFSDLFLQGILTVQITNYFTYQDGSTASRRFTFLVVGLTVMCLLKSAQNIVIVWDTVVTNFANPDISLMLVGTLWWHYTTSLSTAIIASYVQAFFVYRYWLLTRRLWFCILIGIGMVVSLVAACLVIVFIPRLENFEVKKWSLVHFVAAVAVDMAISVGTSYHLWTRKSSIRSTSDMINRLIRMTWQSAIPPAVMIILNMVVLISLPIEISHIALNMTAAKLYAISLMYTLNLRNELRGERMTTNDRSMGGTRGDRPNKKSFMPGDMTLGGDEYGTRSRKSKKGGGMDGIHVETQISTYSSGGFQTIELPNGSPEKYNDVWDGSDHKYPR